ncbi:hypothetical protein Bca4012_074719 [Brassica carinata]|uniref:Uncharacterized protein n=1 Tax=Brassica carinata TaxID=52824 RepID=A0A8X7UAQ0_BRACI|nr:hypothetical protein Bca52824_067135 [Brassica carinata]
MFLSLLLHDCRHFDDVAVIAVVRASRSLQHLKISFCEVSAVGILTLSTLTRVTAQGCPRSQALGVYPQQI